MSPTRLYIEQRIDENSTLEISGDKAHYIGRVLRLRVGDNIIVFDGRGGEFPGRIDSITKQWVRIMVGAHLGENRESQLSIHLLQGLSRGDRMDLVMQKATELGVTKITPVVAEYSVVKLATARAEKKLAHWRGICVSACEQSGRNVLPQVEHPVSFREWLGANVSTNDQRLILKPDAADTLKSCSSPQGSISVFIGPEGGFSDAEYGLAADFGFKAISLGPRILRTETAALAAISSLQTLFGDHLGR